MNNYVLINIFLAIIVVFLVFIGSYYSCFGKNNRYEKSLSIILGSLLILFAGVRTRGWDYELYKSIYEASPVLSDLNLFSYSWQEPSYRIIQSIAKSIYLNYNIFLFIIALITMIFLLKSYSKKSGAPLLFLSLYFYFYFYRNMYGQIRQALAIAIVLFSIKYINKTKIFLFWIFLASTFHKSALIALLIVLLKKKKIRKKKVVLISWIAFYINNYFNEILLFIESRIYFPKLHAYLIISKASELKFYSFECIKNILFFILIFLFDNKINDRKLKTYISIYYFGIILYFLFSFDARLSSRISRYFIIFELFIIPNLMRKSRKKMTIFIIVTTIGFLALVNEFIFLKKGTGIY